MDNPSHGSTKTDTINLHHMVSPNTLNKRLHEVLEVQQKERIMHLQAQVEAQELDLLIKEKELQCWKDIAHHLVNALPANKAGSTERNTNDQGDFCLVGEGSFCLVGEGSRGQQGLSSTEHHARHHLLPDRCKDFKMSGCRTANRKWVPDYEPPARSDSFCESLSDSLIDPSFEAVTLRNSLDWSVGVQSAEAECRKEDSTLPNHDGQQDVCDRFKDLDADKMFPWLLHDEECLPEAPHIGLFTISSLQGRFTKNESCCLKGAKR
ncbi:hypothetical protein L7F22_002844 [Adiantum nelumboides]|nr:hypothetical protein [Adiantum nelumboides]